MPNSLTNQFISDGYIGQLHLGLSSLSAGNFRPVYDGLGNQSSLTIAASGYGASITGSLTAGNIIYPNSSVVRTLVDLIFPVGSIFLSLDSNNPQSRFTGTTWQQISQGRYLAGVGTGTDSNNTSLIVTSGNNNNGTYTTTLTPDQVPDHYHYIAIDQVSTANGANANLDANSYMAYARNPAGVGTFEHRLDGLASVANVGRTSGVVRTTSVSSIPTTNPSYGIYVWQRTS